MAQWQCLSNCFEVQYAFVSDCRNPLLVPKMMLLAQIPHNNGTDHWKALENPCPHVLPLVIEFLTSSSVAALAACAHVCSRNPSWHGSAGEKSALQSLSWHPWWICQSLLSGCCVGSGIKHSCATRQCFIRIFLSGIHRIVRCTFPLVKQTVPCLSSFVATIHNSVGGCSHGPESL